MVPLLSPTVSINMVGLPILIRELVQMLIMKGQRNNYFLPLL